MTEESPQAYTGPPLGTYAGRSQDFSCPGDHVTWEIVLLAEGKCTISCKSELSPSKGGSKAWSVEGKFEWDEDDEEITVDITKEDPLGGPRADREITIEASGDNNSTLAFKGAKLTWQKGLPDPFVEALVALSLKELKAKCESHGLDPAGCIEKQEFIDFLVRAKAGNALKAAPKPAAKASASSTSSPYPKASSTAAPPVAAPAAAPAPAPAAAATAAPAAAPAAAAATTATTTATTTETTATATETTTPTPAATAAAEPAAAPPAAEPAEQQQEDSSGCYTLEQLTDKRTWEKLEDVKPTERETYLPDSVFEGLFGMPKAEFAKLPKWKKDNAKKKHNLF